MKTTLAGLFTLLLLLIPAASQAHPNHGPGAPDHPPGSPDFHETTTTVEDGAGVDARIAMLLRLVELLRIQLALLTDGHINDDASLTWDEDISGATMAGGIETTGNLVMTTDATYRYFKSNGLPEYDVSRNSYANTPSAQDHDFKVPLSPMLNREPTYYNIPYNFGIALNGVTFEPFAAEWYQNDRNSGWQEDPFVTLRDLDDYNAHVQPNGLYHYHGQPTNLIDGDSNTHSSLIGFASDGFPLYGPWVYQDADDPDSELTRIDSSYQLKSGTRAGGPGGRHDGTYNEDYEYSAWGENSLDECNGRFGVTPEFPDGTYYYVATESFPYIPRCLMGDQDPTFAMAGPGSGPR